MNPRRRASAPSHPLFRAMVVMGSGLAVGCGGTTKQEGARTLDDPSQSGGATSSDAAVSFSGGAPGETFGDAGTGGSSSGGEPTQSGNRPDASVALPANGGAAGAGGSTYFDTKPPGSGGSDGADGGPMAECPPAQWDCAPPAFQCLGLEEGWILPASGCTCDPNRPLSAKDCPPDTQFYCSAGTRSGQITTTDAIVPFGCACVPTPPTCGEGCDNGSSHAVCIDPTADPILCGCAVIVLR